MSQHTDQISSVLHRAVQSILSKGLNDPRVRGLISVTKVQVSPDLRHATVFVSVLPDEHSARTLHGLRSASSHVRHQLSEIVHIRRIPELAFKLDESIKREARIHAAINEAVASDRAASEQLNSVDDQEPAREDET